MTNRFITFEGAEGCGKSTHIRLLGDRLRALGHEVVVTREPGGTPLCEAIRGLLQFDAAGESPVPSAETLLFCASRAQLVEKVVRPALARGAWVLSDRFYDSTYAYQGYGRGYDLAALRAIMSFAVGGLRPALTFLLDADPATERARLAQRFASGQAADRFEREAADFHAGLGGTFEDWGGIHVGADVAHVSGDRGFDLFLAARGLIVFLDEVDVVAVYKDAITDRGVAGFHGPGQGVELVGKETVEEPRGKRAVVVVLEDG